MKKVIVLLFLVFSGILILCTNLTQPKFVSTPEAALERVMSWEYSNPRYMREDLAEAGFEEEHIKYAEEAAHIDWKPRIEYFVEFLLEDEHEGPEGIRSSLEWGEYPPEILEYGMGLIPEDMDWQQQAMLWGEDYMSSSGGCPESMKTQMLETGFTPEQTDAVLLKYKDDWYLKALSYGKNYAYPKYKNDREAGVQYMMDRGFTKDEAEAGMAQASNDDFSNRS